MNAENTTAETSNPQKTAIPQQPQNDFLRGYYPFEGGIETPEDQEQ